MTRLQNIKSKYHKNQSFFEKICSGKGEESDSVALGKMPGVSRRILEFFASSAVCEKLASNDDFEIVVREIENLEAHIFKISVSICLSKHCPYLVIETFHGGIGHVPEAPESQNSIPML